ncbi:MAG: RNA-binding domain-containing protein [Anaerohalosphaeraceae bacterium]
MDASEILERIELGEDSTTQFKENITNHASLAEEMVAFSNAIGGLIIVGVKDNGEIKGLSSEDIRRLNNMVSNAASDHVRPPITPLTKTIKVEEKVLLLIDVKAGINKPYSTNNGIYVTKSGADKRRISQEELQRLFQEAQKIYADELPIYDSGINDIDDKLLARYYEKEYGEDIAEQALPPQKILENLCLSKNGRLTLAGLLLFGKSPQLRRPALMVKAISFFGNEIEGTLYRDSEDIKGNIPELFKDSMAFFMRNLHKLQNNKPFNSVGDLEIPKIVLEELLVNALIHRDYFIDAPINIFIFDNRIEIISPGKLPNSISIDNIKHGISVIRNPIITSFGVKLLPYRGIGSGIVRALKHYDKIDFENNHQSERFKVTLFRKQEAVFGA